MNQQFHRRLEGLEGRERIRARAQSAKRTAASLDAFYARVEAAMVEENFQKDPRESWMQSYTRFIGVEYRQFMDDLRASLSRPGVSYFLVRPLPPVRADG